MLLGENRRRNEHGDLPLRLHRLERGAHGDLGLAVADVADEQAVHRPRFLHVALYVGRRLALVGRVLEEERRLELPLPRRVGHMRRTARNASSRVEVEQLDGHLLDRQRAFVALLRPALSAERVQVAAADSRLRCRRPSG